MHPECYAFVEKAYLNMVKPPHNLLVVEFGAFDINGSVQNLFPSSKYIGVDLKAGPGVHVVGDAADLTLLPELHGMVDVVLCLEVFEHAWEWPVICAHAFELLRPGGTFIVTAACDPRLPHSAVDGENLDAWATDISNAEAKGVEYYKNVDPNQLADVLHMAGYEATKVTVLPRGDVQVVTMKPSDV